jgi:hypothetical protein
VRWLIWRELVVGARTRALWVATGAHVGLMMLFVLVWGDGVPVFGARPLFEQFGYVQTAVFMVLLPWIAARFLTEDRIGISALAVLTASHPSHLVIAKWVSATLVLCATVACSLPAAALALEISALPAIVLLRTMPFLVATCGLVAAVTTACMLTSGGRLTGWLMATAATLAACRVADQPMASAAVAVIALGVTGAVAYRADVSWRYATEDEASTRE